MYQLQENIFYYITTYNENYLMPVMPDQDKIPDLEAAITRGGYLYNTLINDGCDDTQIINLLGSGSLMQQVSGAAEKLNSMGFTVNIWSITSYTELCRNGEMCDRWNRLHPFEATKQPNVAELFDNQPGIFIAVTDYMKSLASSITPWMPSNYTVLGTDGYGLSESRKDLRDYFEVSSDYIIHASLVNLYHANVINKSKLESLLNQVDINPEKPNPVER
jgi:pyruvate dehydrogenase E1 component